MFYGILFNKNLYDSVEIGIISTRAGDVDLAIVPTLSMGPALFEVVSLFELN